MHNLRRITGVSLDILGIFNKRRWVKAGSDITYGLDSTFSGSVPAIDIPSGVGRLTYLSFWG